jgi:hypothetical protein
VAFPVYFLDRASEFRLVQAAQTMSAEVMHAVVMYWPLLGQAAEQAEQAVAPPGGGAKSVPDVQSAQSDSAVAPVVPRYLPAGQLVQLPTEPYVPAAQSAVSVQEVPEPSPNRPEGHVWHVSVVPSMKYSWLLPPQHTKFTESLQRCVWPEVHAVPVLQV